MSNINTSGLNVNYPIPGVNNTSQGFRDNFSTIKTNLDTAYTEITELQNKSIVKTALSGASVNNDMANTLISNALTRSFRATTYNLGSSLSGIVNIDVSLGDYQYGIVVANTSLQFSKWAPSGTQSNVQVTLVIANSSAVISFPPEISQDSVIQLENYKLISNTSTVTVASNVTQLDYRMSSIDCGETITVEPYSRPQQSTQLQNRPVSPVGFAGDSAGAVAVDSPVSSVYVSNTFANGSILSTTSVSNFYPDMGITFYGTSFGGITANTEYYVNSTNTSANTFSVSSTPGGANIVLTDTSGVMVATPTNYAYICTGSFNGTGNITTASNTTAVANTITVASTTGMAVNIPIIFSGNTFGGITSNTVYYIKSIVLNDITVSRSRVNGVAGTVYPLTTANGIAGGDMVVTSYNGTPIWQRIKMSGW